MVELTGLFDDEMIAAESGGGERRREGRNGGRGDQGEKNRDGFLEGFFFLSI
jgi:ribosomal protein L15